MKNLAWMALALLGCGEMGEVKEVPSGCARKPGACLAIRVAGSGRYDRAVVILAGPGGAAAGAVATGPLDLPADIVASGFESRVAPAGVREVLVALQGPAGAVQRRVAVSFASGAHQVAQVVVP